jgi:hypothetical protein
LNRFRFRLWNRFWFWLRNRSNLRLRNRFWFGLGKGLWLEQRFWLWFRSRNRLGLRNRLGKGLGFRFRNRSDFWFRSRNRFGLGNRFGFWNGSRLWYRFGNRFRLGLGNKALPTNGANHCIRIYPPPKERAGFLSGCSLGLDVLSTIRTNSRLSIDQFTTERTRSLSRLTEARFFATNGTHLKVLIDQFTTNGTILHRYRFLVLFGAKIRKNIHELYKRYEKNT